MTNATTALIDDVPFPGMPTPPDLWAVHVQGPDDLIPYLDRAEAEKFVAFLDGKDDKERKAKHEFPVYFHARLIEWPYSREAFAEALRDESAA